jgi:peptidoglycan/LPS O-acetylase OafA/YrhL
MTRTESLYFDLTRVVAALLVLIGHVQILMPHALPIQDYGHFAVICFFVLSGYVIAFVSDTKEKTGESYFVSRAARVYSVALPAIILTLFCDFVGHHVLASSVYAESPDNMAPLRVLSALTFTNEIWFQSILIFSDGPYWSLCYEVWYYAIFGAYFYLRGAVRVVTLAVLVVLAGPKMLLLFPIWLLGVALYYYKRALSIGAGTALFVASLAAIVLLAKSTLIGTINHWVLSLVGPAATRLLAFSAHFPMDYLFACAVAANFFAVRSFEGRAKIGLRAAAAIRWAAASTFSLYLFHRPLLLLMTSVFASAPTLLDPFVLIGLTLAMVVALSYFTERKKAFWKMLVTSLLSKVRAIHSRFVTFGRAA